jgi:two-component system, NarL family, response regulator NreC
MNVKILLVDDHAIFLNALHSLLEKDNEFRIVGEAADGRQALEKIQGLKPDVIIIDIAMPGLNGTETARQISERFPGVRIIALSMHSDKRIVAGMLKAGALGYVLKECAYDELRDAIHMVMGGGIYITNKISKIIIRDYVDRLNFQDSLSFTPLTGREREVLQLLAEGKTTREIAATINVSEKTVETFRQHIMDKLELHSVAELTKYAIRSGLTFLE